MDQAVWAAVPAPVSVEASHNHELDDAFLRELEDLLSSSNDPMMMMSNDQSAALIAALDNDRHSGDDMDAASMDDGEFHHSMQHLQLGTPENSTPASPDDSNSSSGTPVANNAFDKEPETPIMSSAEVEALTQALASPPNSPTASPPVVSSSAASAASAASEVTAILAAAAREVAKAPAKKPGRPRKRQKDELDYLRVKVKELQDELDSLRQHEMKAAAEALGSAIAGTVMPPAARMLMLDANANNRELKRLENGESTTPHEHLDLAQRQDMRRVAMENFKLRSLVEGQLAMAKNLEAVFSKRPRIARVGPVTIPQEIMLGQESPFGDVVYDLLRASVEARYKQADALLRECGIGNSDRPVRHSGQVKLDEHGIYFENVECKMLPFHRNDINRVLWCCIGMDTGHTSKYQVRESTDDTMYAKIFDTLRLPHAETNITVRIAMKRFEEANRVTTVWETYIETDGVVSMRLREKGLHMLRAPMIPSSNSEPASISQVCVRVAPELMNGQSDQDIAIGTLTNLVIGSYHRNMGVMEQVIDMLLLAESNKKTAQEMTESMGGHQGAIC